MRSEAGRSRELNDRGVALLIALLVTTLLMALVVEFAYGTRVSLRAAVNFRDSQRAYYLARSGVTFAGKILAENLKNGKPQNNLEQREWQVVPVVSGGDAELRVRWEDEAGKIKIGPSSMDNVTQEWFRELLTNTGVDQEVADKILGTPGIKIRLISELHQFMKDEEFDKVKVFLTAHSSGAINVNTAPETVLKSVLLKKATTPDYILTTRKNKPIDSLAGTDINTSSYLTTSDVFTVHSHATVGGYTKQAEAVITRNSGGFTVQYWKIL